MKEILTMTALVLALAVTALAARSRSVDSAPAAPYVLHLEFESEEFGSRTVRVELDGPPSLTTTRAGHVVTAWTPDEAAAIVLALTDAGREDQIPRVLAGFRVTDAEVSPVCFTFEIAGRDVRVTLPNAPEIGQDGRYIWTAEQLSAIGDALEAAGVSRSSLASLFGLRLSSAEVEPFGDGPTPLTPICGECLSGKECLIRNDNGTLETKCCSGMAAGNVCSVCKVCAERPGLPAVGVDR